MRDPRETQTPDIWGNSTTQNELVTRKPRCRLSGTLITLTDHPHIPPIGYSELARLGSIVAVLRERSKYHEEEAHKHTYYISPELVSRVNQSALYHRMKALRYYDAIVHFERATGGEDGRRERAGQANHGVDA